MTSKRTTNKTLDALVEDMQNNTIHAVVAVDETRLFRDALQVNTFIRLCQARNVVVITPRLVYDFNNPYMVRVFRFMCQQTDQSLQDH